MERKEISVITIIILWDCYDDNFFLFLRMERKEFSVITIIILWDCYTARPKLSE